MKLTEMKKALAVTMDITYKDASEMVDTLLNIMSEALVNDEIIPLTGIGVLKPTIRKGREYKIQLGEHRGETGVYGDKRVVKFAQSSVLARKLLGDIDDDIHGDVHGENT